MLITTIILLLCIMSIFQNQLADTFAKNNLSITKIFITFCVIFFVISMILNPKVVYDGATAGLSAWWNIVFPSLLPFFIASELLMALGIVHFMGVLLEPVMRPLFNVPGSGSFVMVVGFTSGCPISSMVTAKLRRKKICTRIEAERLMCFTNNSSPLFMLVAISVGMFGNPNLGILIAGAHYLANITLGLMLRFYGRNDPEVTVNTFNNRNLLFKAFAELSRIHSAEKRPFAKIVGDAVNNSINNLLKIGGFIILFAVIIRLLNELGVIGIMAQFFALILSPMGFEKDLFTALASGVFEMTLGTKLATETGVPLLQQIIIVAVILGWSGLSIHAQVASMIADTDIRIAPFIISRFVQACLAGLYTYIIWKWQDPVANNWLVSPTLAVDSLNTISPWVYTGQYLKLFLFIITLTIIIGVIYHLVYTILKKIIRKI